jgi:hypothetical protein
MSNPATVMKKHPLILVLMGLVWVCGPALQAQWQTQNLLLQPGWNAVYLSIAPTPADCDTLFGANPRILSVRQWAPPPIEAVQYDEVTGATLPERGSWLTWFPLSHPDRVLLNLVDVAGATAYLIEVSAGAPVNLGLQGRPLALPYQWQPGAHHFVGLPAFSSTVSFSTFFAAAGENILVDYRNGGEVYTVLTSGAHLRVFTPTVTTINPGVAYWVKAQQYSTYSGPIGVKLESPVGWMDFGRGLTPQYLEIRNATSASRGVKLTHLPSGTPPANTPPLAGVTPLKFAIVTGVSEAQGRVYQDFVSSWTTQLEAGASVRVAFLPNALALGIGNTNTAFQSIIEVTDDVGTAGAVRQRFGVRAMARSGSAAESRGLWVGEVNVTEVGRLEMLGLYGLPTTPRPVAKPFNFRLLAHVDANGAARLLQRVFVGTRPDSATGGVITDLIATEARVSAYKAQYAGAKVFRLSSANFPFMAPAALTNGVFGVPNQAVLGHVDVSRDDPVNPFRHAYAPLHDNKERRAEDDIPYDDDVEVFSVRREIEMVFQGPDQVNPEPRWGESVCGGVYRERIFGLGGPLDATNRMITVEGRFVMQRASPVATLLQ